MRRLMNWLPAIVWMGVIFAMSAMPGDVSGETSGRLVRLVLGMISLVFGEDVTVSVDTVHLLVRKGAHMAEYAVLFLCYRHALSAQGAKYPHILALALCAAYAATDELHQGLVEGRGPSIVDVGIDTLGAGIAWIVSNFFVKDNFLSFHVLTK